MPTPRRDRARKPARRPAFRDPKPVILIVCEGVRTEPDYFKGFAKAFRNPRIEVRIAPEHGVPLTLVTNAKDHKHRAESAARKEGDQNLAYDSVWCVFDVDEHPNIPDARQMARDNRIELAISNPCFELWLLIHFRDSPGLRDRTATQRMLLKHVPGYKKGVDFAFFSEGYRDAVSRAERLDRVAQGDPERNPTTGVYRLTRMIEEGGANNPSTART
jgi:RloB-like protein